MNRSYSELITFDNILDRYNYLKLSGDVADITFGSRRILNQDFYSSKAWKDARRSAIIRDASCDLAIPEYEIFMRPVVHHINPITIEDVMDERWDKLLDLENLITVSYDTHQAIHYGNSSMLPKMPIERRPGDTCLWKESVV
jgi:hypothetical protein